MALSMRVSAWMGLTVTSGNWMAVGWRLMVFEAVSAASVVRMTGSSWAVAARRVQRRRAVRKVGIFGIVPV